MIRVGDKDGLLRVQQLSDDASIWRRLHRASAARSAPVVCEATAAEYPLDAAIHLRAELVADAGAHGDNFSAVVRCARRWRDAPAAYEWMV